MKDSTPCEGVLERLAQGDDPAEPGIAAHLADCRACAGVATTRAMNASDDAPGELDGLLARIEADLAAETGIRARMRALPTGARRLIAVAAMATAAIAAGWLTLRADFDVYPPVRLAAELGALALFTGLLVHHSLDPLMRAGSAAVVAVLVAAMLPWIGAVLPIAHQAHPASLAGAGADLAARALGCLTWAALLAVPMLALHWLLERGEGPDRRREALYAAGAALAALLALQLHCPITQRVHLAAGHAPLALVVVLAFVALRRLRMRRSE